MDIDSEDVLSKATKVMPPVKIKIEKSAEAGIEEEADEEEDAEEVAGDGEEESDDEFGFAGISIRPEDVVKSLEDAKKNVNGGNRDGGKQSLKCTMYVFDPPASPNKFIIVPRVKYINNSRDCFKFKPSFLKIAFAGIARASANFYIKQLEECKVLSMRKVPHGSDVVSKNDKDYADLVLCCIFEKGEIESKDNAKHSMVKMMNKLFATKQFKEYYTGVLREKGQGILCLMKPTEDDLWTALGEKRFKVVDAKHLDGIFLNSDIMMLMRNIFGKGSTMGMSQDMVTFAWKSGEDPAGL